MTVHSLLLSLVLIGIPFLLAIGLLTMVCPALAAVRAVNGEAFRYPLTVRFLT